MLGDTHGSSVVSPTDTQGSERLGWTTPSLRLTFLAIRLFPLLRVPTFVTANVVPIGLSLYGGLGARFMSLQILKKNKVFNRSLR